MNETLTYLILTLGIIGGGNAAGIPLDPDRTMQWTGNCAQQEQVGMPGFFAVTMCDKLGHATDGAGVVLISFAIDRNTGREPCLKTAWRGVLRAQVASAAYEVIVAAGNRSRWGQVGYGIGLRDHLAVTGGSLLGGVVLCAARAAL